MRLQLDLERIDYWIGKGAQPSDRVLNLLKQNKETPEPVSYTHLRAHETCADLVCLETEGSLKESDIIIL